MSAFTIFVASSTEAEAIAREVRSLLQQALGASAVVDIWRDRFALSDTAIESLEKVAEDADFAVLVLTGDDLTLSRHKQKLAPRDNLIFELGLFVGALGRERSYLVRERTAELKLPSDILGVTALTYAGGNATELSASLRDGCNRLAEQMLKQEVRPKWLAQGRAALAANGAFCRMVEGAWWEKINFSSGSALSYFAISADPEVGGVLLSGTGYTPDGRESALWKSEMVRLHPSERRIAYLWQGTHPVEGSSNLRFHGYGTMEFDSATAPSGQLTRGRGAFWDIDEARPTETASKPVELRRVIDSAHETIMSTGSIPNRETLVRTVLENW